MKIAFYMEEGLEQIVLTPQTDTETKIMEKLHDGSRDLNIKKGSFFECRGGWIRHDDEGDRSTMIVLHPTKETTELNDATRELLVKAAAIGYAKRIDAKANWEDYRHIGEEIAVELSL